MTSFGRPVPSVPKRTATFSFALISSLSTLVESSVSAIATVLNPCELRILSIAIPVESSSAACAHGIWKTVPMLVLAVRLVSGSTDACVRSTPSIPSAAADLNIAPTFAGFATSTKTAMRFLSLKNSSTAKSGLRLSATHSPRTSVCPVRLTTTSLVAI